MKFISSRIFSVSLIMLTGCNIKTAQRTELLTVAQNRDVFVTYPLKKPDSWFGDKAKEYSVGDYQITDFDSSFTNTKREKDEDLTVSWKRAMVNGHLFETVDEIKETNRKKFSFNLVRNAEIIFSARCRVLTKSEIERDSAFVYSDEYSANLSCHLKDKHGNEVPYDMNNSWHQHGAELKAIGLETVVIQPEFNHVTYWDDDSQTTRPTRTSKRGYSLKRLNQPMTNMPISLITMNRDESISLNKANTVTENDAAVGIMLIQFFYVNYLIEFGGQS